MLPAESRPGGQRTAFEQVVLPHLDAAYNLARWLVADATLAEDVVQDAVLRALAAFAGYRGGSERAWLLAIVRNTAYSTLRTRRGRGHVPLGEEGEVADPAPGPEVALMQQQRLARLDQALAALPAELRECVVLRELEALSYREIGQVTGVPVGTVMSRLWRARQALLKWQAMEQAG
jgi:RNA polymerase sigma-70 factor (ECF subfamily)